MIDLNDKAYIYPLQPTWTPRSVSCTSPCSLDSVSVCWVSVSFKYSVLTTHCFLLSMTFNHVITLWKWVLYVLDSFPFYNCKESEIFSIFPISQRQIKSCHRVLLNCIALCVWNIFYSYFSKTIWDRDLKNLPMSFVPLEASQFFLSKGADGPF